jgi:glutaredoxin
MTYGYLLESIWHPPLAFAETAASTLPAELELQALWFAGAFGRDFRTTTGKKVTIVQFGEWNRGAGPDFIQTAVEIDGELRTGPLELDPVAADWDAHEHAINPAFSEVVLHVVFHADARRMFTRTNDHREVPQVVISEMQLGDALNRPQREVAIAHPGRCVAPLKSLSTGAIEKLLEEAAIYRAGMKASRWLRTADAHGRDAALFQSTAETLGYRGNALPMRLLAQRVPLTLLKAEGDAAEAILFGTAGFLSADLHEQAPPDTREYLRSLWDTWWKNRARCETSGERAIPWKTYGQRPANHPHRRVGALAALVRVWPQYRRLALARPFAAKPVIDFLQALEHEFWNHRHTLTSAASSSRVALFGRSQALELIANHLAPLAMHEDGMTFPTYFKLRNSVANDKVKRCGLRLFGSSKAAAPWMRRVCHHQALMQVYQDFCLEDFSDCQNCPFPEQLAQWR